MKPFTALETSVKQARRRFELGPLNLFLGPNESGKTAVASDSLFLALRGRHPAGSGNMLASFNDHEMVYVDLEGPDARARFKVGTDEEGKFHKAWRLEGTLRSMTAAELDSLLPLYQLRELPTFGSDRGREAIIRRFGAQLEELPKPDNMSPFEASTWAEAVEAIDPGKLDATKALAEVGKYLRSRARASTADIKALERKLAELRDRLREHEALAARVTELPQLERQLVEAKVAERLKTDLSQKFCKLCLQELPQRSPSETERQAQLSYSGPSPAELQRTIDEIRRADASRAAVHLDQERLAQLRKQKKACQSLETEVPALQRAILEDLKQRAEAEVNRFMPPGYRAELDIDAMEWKSVDKNGVARGRHFASGAVWGHLSIALRLAYSSGTATVLILDEEDLRPFDSKQLMNLFDHLRALFAQDLLTQVFATVKCTSQDRPIKPHGWTVYQMPAGTRIQ